MTDADPPKRRPWFIPAVIRWRLAILALWLVVITTSGIVYLTQFRIDNSVAIWFLEDDPELATYESHNTAFGEQEWTYIWLRGDSVFEPEFLRDLQLLGKRIESLDNVTRVVSLTEAAGISQKPDGLPAFGRIYSTPDGTLPDREEIQKLRDKISNSPLFNGRIIPRDNDQFTILAVRNANRIHAIEPYRIRLIDEVRASIAHFPTMREAGIVGTTVVNAELNRAARRDMLIYYTLIAAFVLVAGGLLLGSLRDLIVLGAVVVGTVLPILGIIGALQVPFNLMTVMLPTLLVTVSVSYLIHFLLGFHNTRRGQEIQEGPPDTEGALVSTFGRLLRPGLWTMATTAIAFASLAVSPVAPIRHIGIFAAGGIALAWLATITIAPALLSLLWRPNVPEHRKDTTEGEGSPVVRWLARPHPLLAVLLGAAMLAGACGLVRLEADTNYVKFFRPGSTVRNDYAQLEKLGMPGSYLTLTVQLPKEAHLPEPSRHHAMRSLPNVIDVQSLDGLVAQLSEEATDTGEQLSPQHLLAMSAAGKLTEAEEFLSDDRHVLRLRVMTDAMSTRDINAFRTSLETLASEQPDAWDITLTGTTVLWANMDAHVVRTQLLTIGITAVVLLILLPLVFRSLSLGILGFVVSFVPVLCTLGLMAWIGLPVNIATCILGGVVMGIAVDDTIYYLSSFREQIRTGATADFATRRATMTTGRAMIKTSLILTGGFLTMAASDFLPSVYFGIFFAFVCLFGLFGRRSVGFPLSFLLVVAAPRLAFGGLC